MGRLNQPEYYNQLPEVLREELCPLCSSTVAAKNFNAENDGFEFICTSCNENIIINISSSLIKSPHFTDLKNNLLKESIVNTIRNFKKDKEKTTFYLTEELFVQQSGAGPI